MEKYIKGSLTSSCIGIWWIYQDSIIGRSVPLNDGYNDGQYIHYDDFKNHSTEWRSVLKEQAPNAFDTLYPKMFKCIERGRVVYNIRTQSYEIICSESVSQDIEAIKLVVAAFDLENCRYDVYSDHHYYVTEPTGNPAIDDIEYGFH